MNLGTLGYMTEVEVPNLEESLERLIAGDYVQESHILVPALPPGRYLDFYHILRGKDDAPLVQGVGTRIA